MPYNNHYFIFMFYCGLKKGTILYRKLNDCIEISEISMIDPLSFRLFSRRYLLTPIIGEWTFCDFSWLDSTKCSFDLAHTYKPIRTIRGLSKRKILVYYPRGTNFDKVYNSQEIIKNRHVNEID